MVEDSNSGVPEAAKEATPRRWPHFALPDGTSTGRPVILIWAGDWGAGPCQMLDAETRFAVHGGTMEFVQIEKFIRDTGVVVADWPHPRLLAADGWQPASTAPKTAELVQLGYPPHSWNKPAIIIAHWACDESGDEQPPFRGWFQANVGDNGRVYGFREVPKGFVAWRPLWPKEPQADEVKALRQAHDRRVTELLEANNREVERRRDAERQLAALTPCITRDESLPSMRGMMAAMAAARAEERRACLRHVMDAAQAERDRLARYVVKSNGDHHQHAAVALDGVAHAIITRGLQPTPAYPALEPGYVRIQVQARAAVGEAISECCAWVGPEALADAFAPRWALVADHAARAAQAVMRDLDEKIAQEGAGQAATHRPAE